MDSKNRGASRALARPSPGLWGRLLAFGTLLTGLCGCVALPPAEVRGDRVAKIREYQQEAARLRGLDVRGEVAVERETSSELRVSLERELDKAENQAFLGDTERLLKRFKALAPDASLRSAYLAAMTQQIAAYYDPEKKRLAYVDENVESARKQGGGDQAGMERFVYVHEFCHALEDAHYDLDALTKASLADLDRNLALTSFVEGNAVLVGVDGMFDGYGLPMNTATPLGAWLIGLLDGFDMESAEDEVKGLPPFLAGALLRPYLDGAVFSSRIRHEAGWQAVDEVYRSRLPLTTAEVLYPERRYLQGFRPARIEPAPGLFDGAAVQTNALGAMAIALWLGGEAMPAANEYGFLKGWMGDQVYLFDGCDGQAYTVWISVWERPGMAGSFCRRAAKRLKQDFGEEAFRVGREGRVVAVVWDASGKPVGARGDTLVEQALQARIDVETPGLLASWARDIPWPLRFPSYEGYSSGCDVLGGYVLGLRDGESFFKLSLASGLLARAENNPDRHYYGLLGGLVRHVRDERSDFTYWKVPLLASWHRRGSGDDERYRWTVGWGLLASGTESRVRVLLVPVWHDK